MTYFGYALAGVLLIVALIVAIYAQVKVNSTYNTYSKVPSKSGLTGRDLAEKIIAAEGLQVTVNPIGGKLSDNYDPTKKQLNISKENMNSTSVAALGVVAHELGHAMQDARNYKPMKVRHAVIKVSNFMSGFLVPLLVIGLILDLLLIGGVTGQVFIWAAVGLYGLSTLVNLVTLPVETNASGRAMQTLRKLNVMDEVELKQTKKVLSAAALTYLAALLVSLAYFLRFLFIALQFTRDR